METIDYDLSNNTQFEKLFDMSVHEGTITAVDVANNEADVDIDGDIGSKAGVEIFYHCEDGLTTSGATAFSVDDRVLVINEKGQCSPAVSDLKIMGFVGELKMCLIKFYLRAQINGNTLIHGGQRFHIHYKNGAGVWKDTDIKVVHGNSIGDQSEKYFYCGPFEFTDGWSGDDVEIHLYGNKTSALMSPTTDVRTIGGEKFYDLDKMFWYWMTGGDTKLQITKWGGHNGSDSSNNLHDPNHVNQYSPWRSRRADIFLGMAASDPDPQAEWVNATKRWKKRVGAGYTWVETIYKTFTEAEFRILLNNSENEIYNWDSSEFEEDQRVIIPNLVFTLKNQYFVVPPKSLQPALGGFYDNFRYYPYDGTVPTIRHGVGLHVDLLPNFFEWVINWSTSSFDVRMESGNVVAGYYDYYTTNPWFYFGAAYYCAIFCATPENCIRSAYSQGIWTFNGTTYHDIENLITDADDFVHVISDRENPSPQSLSFSGTLNRVFNSGWIEELDENCEVTGTEYGISIDPKPLNFSLADENLPIHYY